MKISKLVNYLIYLFIINYVNGDNNVLCDKYIENLIKQNITIDNMQCNYFNTVFKDMTSRCKDKELDFTDIIQQMDDKCNPKPNPEPPKGCYGCNKIGTNEYVGGLQGTCNGSKYRCNTIGTNCDTCWTNNSDTLKKWCEEQKYYDKDNKKYITYKVQHVGDFNCVVRYCWPWSGC